MLEEIRSVLDNLGARHGFALGLIAITATLSFFMFWVALTSHDQGQDQLILLANQVARAERLVLDSQQLLSMPAGESRDNTRRFMETTIRDMTRAHGDYVYSLTHPFRFGTNSPDVIPLILFGPEDNLDTAIQRFLDLAQRLATTSPADLRLDNPDLRTFTTQARTVLVPQLEALHDIHLSQLHQTTQLATWIAFFMWVALMALLVMEARLVFWPLARQVSNQVNDLRAAYDDLEIEKRKFEGTLAGLPNAVVVVDEDGVITKVNTATEQLLGYGEEELVGKPIEILVPPSTRAEHHTLRQDIGRKQVRRIMGRRRDITAMRKDGSRLPVEINLNTVHLGNDTVVIATIIDLSDRIALESNRLKDLHSAVDALVDAAKEGRVEDMATAEAKTEGLLHRLLSTDAEGADHRPDQDDGKPLG
jgi:PAS domain S-box-containing protein